MPSPVALLFALALLLVSPAGCRRAEESAAAQTRAGSDTSAPLHVTTATVALRPVPQVSILTGTLRANEESNVAADASGKVLQVLVERGQKVARGQVIATLDARSAALSATAANAQSRLAESQLDQARRECERVKHLLETAAISQAEFDRQTAQCTAQQWSAAAAEAQQQSATKLLGDTRIRAPFDGIIGERMVNVGQYVEPSTRVASVYQPNPLRLALTVPESDLAFVKEGMPVTFTVPAFGDTPFVATIKFISPNVRESSRDLVVEAMVPNADGRLRPGMFALARLQLGEKPGPVAPRSAVARDDTETRVFVVGPDHRVQERLVQLGAELGDDGTPPASPALGQNLMVAVLAGLKAGEVIVTQPGGDVRDGVLVER
jgi:membrane fusion protein (multidrug efflux system)